MSKGKLLAVCLVWLVIVAAIAATYRLLIYPRRQDATVSGTSSSSQYKHTVALALDSFSGYAILRSEKMKEELAHKRIRLRFVDDAADYAARIQALRSGQVPMAVFTIDALLTVCDEMDELPATIVAILDETRGADAVVAYQQAVPNIDALNSGDMRFILTPNSPSETLARVVITHFNLDNLNENPFLPVSDAEAVYKAYRKAAPATPQAFVLWEPYVSKVLENPNTHIVTDSSQFRGYIVDVLVVNRDWLLKNEAVVLDVLGSYFRSAYHYRDSMVDLVVSDARLTGTPITQPQAQKLVEGIWWKNTQENFAHFGIQTGQSLQLLEDMIGNIVRVLNTTRAIERDPTGGQPNLLYYDNPLLTLKNNQFHPGLESETIRDDTIKLLRLDDAGWNSLVPVGTLSVPPLVFARGTARLTSSSKAVLDDLVTTLKSLPRAYVLVNGNASLRGELEANQRLAMQRAQAAEKYLIAAGVDENRIRAVAGQPSGSTSVSFVLGQLPY